MARVVYSHPKLVTWTKRKMITFLADRTNDVSSVCLSVHNVLWLNGAS